MGNKHYNLTKPYNEGVVDKSPDWLDPFFKKQSNKNENKKTKENPFKNVDNFLYELYK